jgi:hypothetical protein
MRRQSWQQVAIKKRVARARLQFKGRHETTAAAAIFPELTAVKNVISGTQTCAHALKPGARGVLKEAFCLSAANE